MKKKLLIIFFIFFTVFAFTGQKEYPIFHLINQSNSDFFFISNLNGMEINYNSNNKMIINDNGYSCRNINNDIRAFPCKPGRGNGIPLVSLPFDSQDFEVYCKICDYVLLFNKNGTLIKRIDDISKELIIENKTYSSITITETAPIASVPLNYPAIPEDYRTDRYYIKNNTDELVYVVAPDYIGVPHPEAGILEEGESFFIPSQQVTNGLSFYRALFPGESFYLGKAAHPDGQEYIQNASEGFNEYLPLIYLVTPEMNVLYRLENFENYKFTETSNTDGKKIVLELQEEMSVRHSEYFMADF